MQNIGHRVCAKRGEGGRGREGGGREGVARRGRVEHARIHFLSYLLHHTHGIDKGQAHSMLLLELEHAPALAA
jgi:hypothetical protein